MKKINIFYETKIEEMTRSKIYLVERLKVVLSANTTMSDQNPTTDNKNIDDPSSAYVEALNQLTVSSAMTVAVSNHSRPVTGGKRRRQQRKEVTFLKKSLLEFYRALLLLQNYQKLNYTCLTKILKKFDKVTFPRPAVCRPYLGFFWDFLF